MYVYLSAKCDGKAISNQFNENLANKKDDESLCSICKDLSGKKEASTILDSTLLDYIKTTRGNTLYNIFIKHFRPEKWRWNKPNELKYAWRRDFKARNKWT